MTDKQETTEETHSFAYLCKKSKQRFCEKCCRWETDYTRSKSCSALRTQTHISLKVR